MANERLTAEEFREKILSLMDTEYRDGFTDAVISVCEDELNHRDELKVVEND